MSVLFHLEKMQQAHGEDCGDGGYVGQGKVKRRNKQRFHVIPPKSTYLTNKCKREKKIRWQRKEEKMEHGGDEKKEKKKLMEDARERNK